MLKKILSNLRRQPSYNKSTFNFTGTLSVKRIRVTDKWKVGHFVLTPQGIGEIIQIYYQLKIPTSVEVKLLKSRITGVFKIKDLKKIVVYSNLVEKEQIPIDLSFLDYTYYHPYGITHGKYSFTLTNNGYARMTKQTKHFLEINRELNKTRTGINTVKLLKKYNCKLIKKSNHE